ncbi:hypothetical protein HAX54_010638, partial [Datura stramonium]|nr:hypothetical protein [Datura stramonium]
FVVLDCNVDQDIAITLRRPFLATERALMDSEKHEIIFRVKDDRITFKIGRGHLLPIGVGDIFVSMLSKEL